MHFTVPNIQTKDIQIQFKRHVVVMKQSSLLNQQLHGFYLQNIVEFLIQHHAVFLNIIFKKIGASNKTE